MICWQEEDTGVFLSASCSTASARGSGALVSEYIKPVCARVRVRAHVSERCVRVCGVCVYFEPIVYKYININININIYIHP